MSSVESRSPTSPPTPLKRMPAPQLGDVPGLPDHPGRPPVANRWRIKGAHQRRRRADVIQRRSEHASLDSRA
jgi:hypothetical protein